MDERPVTHAELLEALASLKAGLKTEILEGVQEAVRDAQTVVQERLLRLMSPTTPPTAVR